MTNDATPSRFDRERCTVRTDGTVEHIRCHTYADGTVTDPARRGSAYVVTGGFRGDELPPRATPVGGRGWAYADTDGIPCRHCGAGTCLPDHGVWTHFRSGAIACDPAAVDAHALELAELYA